mmetsp:Transcript_14108/g.26390  ORF Transcript_14108/g.26390 Transcript_14108/m.26390 type:complete len:245 (-) Transcript_14108:757-1491(-)
MNEGVAVLNAQAHEEPIRLPQQGAGKLDILAVLRILFAPEAKLRRQRSQPERGFRGEGEKHVGVMVREHSTILKVALATHQVPKPEEEVFLFNQDRVGAIVQEELLALSLAAAPGPPSRRHRLSDQALQAKRCNSAIVHPGVVVLLGDGLLLIHLEVCEVDLVNLEGRDGVEHVRQQAYLKEAQVLLWRLVARALLGSSHLVAVHPGLDFALDVAHGGEVQLCHEGIQTVELTIGHPADQYVSI